ncbi:MAG: hypothetical protein ACFHWX_15720 [Bacteroidota bacterium]
MEITDLITIIGIALTFIVSAISLYISIKTSRKTLFINSVTSSRIKWINDLREDIASFTGLVTHYRITDIDSRTQREIYEKIDRLVYSIMLRLNPKSDIDMETEIISRIDLIIEEIDSKKDKIDDVIEELIDWTRIMLKFEWEVVKEESLKGRISNKKKLEIYTNFTSKNADLYRIENVQGDI